MSFKIVEGRLLMAHSIIRDYGPILQNDINALISKMQVYIIIIRRIEYYTAIACNVLHSLSIVINITIIIIIIIIININIIIIAYAPTWIPSVVCCWLQTYGHSLYILYRHVIKGRLTMYVRCPLFSYFYIFLITYYILILSYIHLNSDFLNFQDLIFFTVNC